MTYSRQIAGYAGRTTVQQKVIQGTRRRDYKIQFKLRVIKTNLMHYLSYPQFISSVNFYMFRTYLQPTIRRYVFLDAATVTEVFPCFFLGCKANARVILAKTRHGPHSSKIVVLFYVLFVLYCSMYCLCVNVYCHRVTTQLQLTNISYHIYNKWYVLCFLDDSLLVGPTDYQLKGTTRINCCIYTADLLMMG